MNSGSKTNAGSWRDGVLRYFSSEIAAVTRVTVVADPDGLLLDDAVCTTLAQQGFDVIPYVDSVKFRFYYESRHRSRWDAGQHSSIVVSVPHGRDGLGRMPFDVLSEAEISARVFDVGLATVFPNLACDVLAELDVADLDAVWGVSRTLGKESLGGNQTRDLVLRSVFKLSADMVSSETDLVVQLVRLHHAKRVVPRNFAERFASALQRDGRFDRWPIAELCSSPDEFFRMLQDRWERCLHKLDPRVAVRPVRPAGPDEVDFASPDVAAILDNLFIEGRLIEVEVSDPALFNERSDAVGIRTSSTVPSSAPVRKLLEAVRSEVPEPDVPPTVWTRYALRWAELVGIADALATHEWTAIRDDFASVRDAVDDRLWDWLVGRFSALINRSFLPVPTVVHHIPHLLAHRRRPGDKVALVVVDGMSLSQWTDIRRAAGPAWMEGMTVEESAVFAWIPTVTSVSRQAILSGQPPMFFEATIHTTSAEERLWKSFWEGRGWRRDRIAYIKQKDGELELALVERVWESVDSGQAECVAVIVNSIDRLVHGVGPEGNVLAAAVRQWGQNGHISHLLRGLVDRGFDIALCSDHGNVESVGVGRPDMGSIPEDQGQRAITFPDAGTLDAARRNIVGSRHWPGPGLPPNSNVLMPAGRGAFSTAGATLRTHGGPSIEEVFVPWIRVSRHT